MQMAMGPGFALAACLQVFLAMSTSSRDEGLCCCEYARASDGATRHLLQFLCECDAFDQLADEMLDSCCDQLCRGRY